MDGRKRDGRTVISDDFALSEGMAKAKGRFKGSENKPICLVLPSQRQE